MRGRWFRVASLVGFGALLALTVGPLLGATLILLTDAPAPLLNVVAGVVYALGIPFVALPVTGFSRTCPGLATARLSHLEAHAQSAALGTRR